MAKRRTLTTAQEADGVADSEQPGMVNVRNGAGQTVLPGALVGRTMWRYQHDLPHGTASKTADLSAAGWPWAM